MDDQQALRKQLETRLEEIERRLHRIERNRRRESNALDPDWQEQATVRQNDEVLDGLEEEEKRQIAAIQAALKRMQDGTYGDCVTCGEAIARARLQALPYAVQCITCASRAEHRG
jgi:DnaK suppressor protein